MKESVLRDSLKVRELLLISSATICRVATGMRKRGKKLIQTWNTLYVVLVLCGLALCGTVAYAAVLYGTPRVDYSSGLITSSTAVTVSAPQLDTALYDNKMWLLANNGTSSPPVENTTTTASSTKHYLWPVKTVYPNAGALLPFHRIVAYYGNFYSTGMGVLGQYPPTVMIEKLKATVAQWVAADPSTPVIPAIDYIAVTAQASPVDGKYRARMPDSQIDKALELADSVHGIVVLDVQVGLSTLQTELPLLEKYLKKPNVHLAIDPEFSMKTGAKPGDVIGTFSAADINYAAQYLAILVRENDLPPKMLIVHRFTEDMVTGYRNIHPLPEVQIVMDMDGWGSPAKKMNTYNVFITSQPVQFTGFKLFYRNDLKPPSTRMMTPTELLKLKPIPIFIQYQ